MTNSVNNIRYNSLIKKTAELEYLHRLSSKPIYEYKKRLSKNFRQSKGKTTKTKYRIKSTIQFFAFAFYPKTTLIVYNYFSYRNYVTQLDYVCLRRGLISI